jgi:dihydrofolate reductase
MGVVEIALSMSLDGFITGPDPRADQPLGVGGDAVLRPGGERWMVDELLDRAGAVVAGRNTYDITGGWGEEPPYRNPVFVPTHRPREPRVAGATTFTFVPDVATAVERAKAAAGGKNVYIVGGASVADQALRLGMVDELFLHIEPVLLGGGTRLFADLGGPPIRLERIGLIEGEVSTHVRYRVLR